MYLTQAQVHALAAEAKHYRPLILLLCYCGPRWGEVAALRVRNIDFLRRRISLEENAVTVGRAVHVGSLKGYKQRTVPLPRFVGDELAAVCRGKTRDDLLWRPLTADIWLHRRRGHRGWRMRSTVA